jgi:hypothetical protein
MHRLIIATAIVAISIPIAGMVRSPAPNCNSTTATKEFHKIFYDRIEPTEFQAEWIPKPRRPPPHLVKK